MSIRVMYWRAVMHLVAAAFVWHRTMQVKPKMTPAERLLFDAVSSLRADIQWADRPVNSGIRLRCGDNTAGFAA